MKTELVSGETVEYFMGLPPDPWIVFYREHIRPPLYNWVSWIAMDKPVVRSKCFGYETEPTASVVGWTANRRFRFDDSFGEMTLPEHLDWRESKYHVNQIWPLPTVDIGDSPVPVNLDGWVDDPDLIVRLVRCYGEIAVECYDKKHMRRFVARLDDFGRPSPASSFLQIEDYAFDWTLQVENDGCEETH